MRFRTSWPLLPLALLVAGAAPAPAFAAPPAAPRGRPVVDPAVHLAFLARPDLSVPRRAPGSTVLAPPRLRQAPKSVPVVIEYSRPVTASDLAALESAGALDIERFSVSPGPRSRLRSRLVLADLPSSAVPVIGTLDGVAHVTLDGPLFGAPRPLDYTAAQVQATDVWRTRGADGLSVDGHGITICDIDSGVDIFHPLFFRADGNGGKPYMSWVDTDGDGLFTAGVDGVDLRGDGAVVQLRIQNSLTTEIFDDKPLFDSDDPSYDLGFDYLYADVNGSGAREQGPEGGFTEQDPTYGEQLFTADDVNGNGLLDAGEKLVALGTSKLRAVRFDKKVYRRGENLIDLPITNDAYHGTGASGVLVAGTPGLTRLVGMAPGADLVMAANTDGTNELKLAKFCHDEGARVILHEYAPWIGYHLDGSSLMEQFIDETMAENTVHVNPAGNLSGSDKLYKNDITPASTTDVLVEAPGWGFTFFGFSFLWRDPSRPLTFVVEDPTGFTTDLTKSAFGKPWKDGLIYYTSLSESGRGTSRVDFYLFSNGVSPVEVPSGTWKIRVTDPAPAGSPKLTLIGYVEDELSGWGKGIFFPEHASEDHYIGYPGTADHGIPIAAYTGHGFWGDEPDARASYSGRGLRIDGTPILWLSAPDDPITSGSHDGSRSLHVIYGGTSGASPHVAGTSALYLAENPASTGDDVKEALRKGAFVDDHVLSAGPVPNTDYGYGKLRIHETLRGEPPPGGSAPTLTIAPVTVEEGDTAELTLSAADPDEPAKDLTLELDRDYDGTFDEKLAAPSLSVATSEIGTLVSKVRVTDSTGRSAAALAVVHVVEKGTLPDPETPSDVEVAGGGACAVDASPSAPRGGVTALLFGALALLSLRRRPRV